jgi:hypothetical protein
MKSFHQKSLMVASSLAMLLALGACDKLENRTAGTNAGPGADQKSSKAAKEETQDAKARANAKNDSSTKAMGASGEQKKY